MTEPSVMVSLLAALPLELLESSMLPPEQAARDIDIAPAATQGDALGGELRVHSVLPLFLKTLHIPFNAHLGKNHVHLNPRARNHGDHS